MVLIPNTTGKILFHRNITRLPKINTPAAMAIGMNMALLIQKLLLLFSL
jgi:hypothetical protein